jgi:hypothetical protein
VLLSASILSIGRSSTIMDFGGGDGFVCRLLRDLGFDAVVYDKYVKNTYAEGFQGSLGRRAQVITCFEVWEHLSRPSEEIGVLFSSEPDLVVVSTDIYRRQGPGWPYLGSSQGGHVFFYSEQAMKLIAAKYGYNVITRDSTTIFSRARISLWRSLALNQALSPAGLLLGRLWSQLLRPQQR